MLKQRTFLLLIVVVSTASSSDTKTQENVSKKAEKRGPRSDYGAAFTVDNYTPPQILQLLSQRKQQQDKLDFLKDFIHEAGANRRGEQSSEAQAVGVPKSNSSENSGGASSFSMEVEFKKPEIAEGGGVEAVSGNQASFSQRIYEDPYKSEDRYDRPVFGQYDRPVFGQHSDAMEFSPHPKHPLNLSPIPMNEDEREGFEGRPFYPQREPEPEGSERMDNIAEESHPLQPPAQLLPQKIPDLASLIHEQSHLAEFSRERLISSQERLGVGQEGQAPLRYPSLPLSPNLSNVLLPQLPPPPASPTSSLQLPSMNNRADYGSDYDYSYHDYPHHAHSHSHHDHTPISATIAFPAKAKSVIPALLADITWTVVSSYIFVFFTNAIFSIVLKFLGLSDSYLETKITLGKDGAHPFEHYSKDHALSSTHKEGKPGPGGWGWKPEPYKLGNPAYHPSSALYQQPTYQYYPKGKEYGLYGYDQHHALKYAKKYAKKYSKKAGKYGLKPKPIMPYVPVVGYDGPPGWGALGLGPGVPLGKRVGQSDENGGRKGEAEGEEEEEDEGSSAREENEVVEGTTIPATEIAESSTTTVPPSPPTNTTVSTTTSEPVVGVAEGTGSSTTPESSTTTTTAPVSSSPASSLSTNQTDTS